MKETSNGTKSLYKLSGIEYLYVNVFNKDNVISKMFFRYEFHSRYIAIFIRKYSFMRPQ